MYTQSSARRFGSRSRSFTRLACVVVASFLAAAVYAQSVLPPGGTLYVEFGSNDRVRFVPASGQPPAPVPIYNLRDVTRLPKDDCKFAIGASGNDATLLQVAAADGLVLGFNDQKDWVGIRENKKGVDCGRVRAGQAINLAIGTSLNNLKAVVSTLSFTVKKSAVIEVQAKAGGSTKTYIVRSGLSVVPGVGNPPPGASPGDWNQVPGDENIFNCGLGADSGPDVDASCTVQITDAIWDQLELRTLAGNNGEWSLGSGTSVFELAEVTGVLDCQESTVEAEDPNSGSVGQLLRLDNVDQSQCVPIPYSLRFEDQQLDFVADYGGQNTSFQWMVVWAPENVAGIRPEDDPGTPEDDRAIVVARDGSGTIITPVTGTATANVPLSTQRFLSSDPEYFLDLCLGTPDYDDDPGNNIPDGTLVSVQPPVEGFPDLSGADGVQYGCWVNRTIDYLESLPEDPSTPVQDWIQVRETGYVQGDWTATRKF